MDNKSIIECAGFYFIHNFDSGNLGHVEQVPSELIAPSLNLKTNSPETPDYEFNLWTRPDCAGTEFENGNRTWFYFGIQASQPGVLVRLNLINLNKQGKMYNQGMAPVTRTLPGKPQWERIKDRPVHSTDDNTFTLSFKYKTAENPKATTFFAFTYPYSFAELQLALNAVDGKMLPLPAPQSPDDIYYCRECLTYSLEGRRVDLLTITSHHGITTEREERLKNLFPENQERPFKFQNKKVIFISARVHPGETPSSFVFNGFLSLLLARHDPVALQLRKCYVFKMIPFLNPDGVARGHYRTDTRGVNLNRVYLNPSPSLHPTVYASRALIRYYHFGCEKEDNFDDNKALTSRSMQNISESAELLDNVKKKKSPYKREYYKNKEKSLGSNKSSGNLQPMSTDSSCKDATVSCGEAANLADQVYDMKLQEMPSQLSSVTTKESNIEEGSCRLSDDLLRTCLGSTVHVSTSEELNIPGSNPLKPLRETLKNSISLLMESGSSIAGDGSVCGGGGGGGGGGGAGRACGVRMGWCGECRRALRRLERSMPGVAAMLPGYTAGSGAGVLTAQQSSRSGSPTFSSITEYREHQMQQFDRQELEIQDMEQATSEDSAYFCTNCFKRFVMTGPHEEVQSPGAPSTISVAVSAGNGDGPSPEISLTQAAPVIKEEKPKPTSGKQVKKKTVCASSSNTRTQKEPDSGLFLYIDLHGHASKKGIFMYGNHFEDVERSVECMLLPRIMSLNNLHFHFASCNFTERNMYLKDRRDGMSREGSGRVAVLKATGLVRSYTLECNYNTGRLVNVLPPPLRDRAPPSATPLAPPPATPHTHAPQPPKYTPHIFEEVGRSLGASILDVTGQHPNSRIPCSEHRSLAALRDWLRVHSRTMRPQLTMSRLRPKTSSPSRVPLYARTKTKVVDERKENAYAGAKAEPERRRSPPVLAPRSGHEIINVNVVKYVKKTEPVKTSSRTRYLADTEPKPKTLSTKRRNILAIRKPNSSKSPAGVVKAKAGRRSADDSESSRSALSVKASKRNFARTLRGAVTRSGTRARPAPSSSSDDVAAAGTWEEIAGGTALSAAHSHAHPHPDTAPPPGKRRSFPNPGPHLKKIRLKTAL
ncbi:Cytosolic carboxypeptidase-like protein 5 [Papilio xuthus]|uniref:Cytosolic carboxypeptidase-like protein 5 n=1 Tax=Papilio xuthus TaxID=66420 RepID=A0A194QD67_PAPXU|nr:Cytosolic carboxypeptidase-like protein 5 [Papilio xuthus]